MQNVSLYFSVIKFFMNMCLNFNPILYLNQNLRNYKNYLYLKCVDNLNKWVGF